MAMRSHAARFSDMALICWSNARPHWMQAGLDVAYRRAEARMSSGSRSQIGAAHSGVRSLTPSHRMSRPVAQYSMNS